MQKEANRKVTNILPIFVTLLGFSQIVIANDELRQVDHITWNKSTNTPYVVMSPEMLAPNESNIIFIRPLDNDGLQTSANIGIDNRFQVSLQPGHYSQILYCSGQHNINVAPTGLKTNDLEKPFSYVIDFAPQKNYYVYVDVDDETGTPNLSLVEEAFAQKALTPQMKQTHQISRVVTDCPEIIQSASVPKPKPDTVNIEIDKPINLKVLFEFDKAVIQPVFNARIEAVANFMKKYPDTSTVIEGHTDSMGSNSYNMKLSQRRADAVKQELVNKYGIAPNRLSTVGYGEMRPADTNTTPEGRYNNRRVVATVSATQKYETNK